ncbi:DUF4097 family beta strand repeat-containing protein [Paenibacillus sp. L3-i20]|uniref:DUF4097 family beta strand repeat-containing protein n=1 Tax=Paenibacillus sp. L3-i20 TaxID=2905833 RepID=UPI001EDF4641|nr:DUF4097 family beta strand repeat-containing protein [Paenibacillus sp. L3-i20]
MKLSRFFGLLLVVIGVVALFYVLSPGEGSPFKKLFKMVTKEISVEEKYDINDLKHLSIDDSSMNIDIIPGSSSQAIVRMTGSVSKNVFNEYKLEGRKDGDTLRIKTKSGDGWNWFTWSTVKLTIELPEKQWEEFTVYTNSGNISVQQVLSTKLSLKTSSGNIQAKEVEGQAISLKSTSGNIKLSEASSDDVELKTSSGNITVEEYEAKQIDINTVSGNIKAIEGLSEIKAKSSSGNITIKGEDLLHDTDLKSTSGNVTIDVYNEPTSLAVDYSGGSGQGNIKISNFSYETKSNDRDVIKGAFGTGETELIVRTSSGNFTLK